MKKLTPFILSLGGIMSDYMTTMIGLSLGLAEAHPSYHPLNALVIFWGAITLLTLLLPREKLWAISINGIAMASYLGVVNNTLVLVRFFRG